MPSYWGPLVCYIFYPKLSLHPKSWRSLFSPSLLPSDLEVPSTPCLVIGPLKYLFIRGRSLPHKIPHRHTWRFAFKVSLSPAKLKINRPPHTYLQCIETFPTNRAKHIPSSETDFFADSFSWCMHASNGFPLWLLVLKHRDRLMAGLR